MIEKLQHAVKNSMPINGACRRNLNVENATNSLDDAVAGLREVVDALEAHLQPLLGDERPIGNSEDRCRGDSEVAERILTNADGIRARSIRIRELIDRL